MDELGDKKPKRNQKIRNLGVLDAAVIDLEEILKTACLQGRNERQADARRSKIGMIL